MFSCKQAQSSGSNIAKNDLVELFFAIITKIITKKISQGMILQ